MTDFILGDPNLFKPAVHSYPGNIKVVFYCELADFLVDLLDLFYWTVFRAEGREGQEDSHECH
jgi:hypothetical protein